MECTHEVDLGRGSVDVGSSMDRPCLRSRGPAERVGVAEPKPQRQVHDGSAVRAALHTIVCRFTVMEGVFGVSGVGARDAGDDPDPRRHLRGRFRGCAVLAALFSLLVPAYLLTIDDGVFVPPPI